MRYDRGYGRGYHRGYDRSWQGGPARLPRYDEVFGRAEHDYRRQWERGYDADFAAETPWGRPLHSPNQHPEPRERDFLGRPYPPQAMEDLPWGLMNAERMHRMRGYDRGYREGGSRGGYDRGYAGSARYDREYGRPEDYHPRFIPDSDVGGRDAHQLRRGPMHHTSQWTRWF